MASSLASFRRYQREQAWTWEHQALTRARFVAGDATIGAAFEAERETILRTPRDRERLAADVIEMRRKMAAGHPNRTASFDLKHDVGGMVDVEFAVQYVVLAHAHEHPALTGNLGNIALLRIAGELALVPADARSRRCRRLPRVSPPAAPGAAHRRTARPRRSGSAGSTARRGLRALGSSVRRPARLKPRRTRCADRVKSTLWHDRETPRCPWPTAMAGSGTTARWCRGATRRRTSSRTRSITASGSSRAYARTRRPTAPRSFACATTRIGCSAPRRSSA